MRHLILFIIVCTLLFPIAEKLVAQSTVPFINEITTANSGTKLYQARSLITFGPGFSYTPSGGTLTTQIVDPLVTTNVVYNATQSDPAGRTINTTYKPGTLPGSVDVSQVGSAGYTIPIEVPTGVDGFQPALAISYSSMAGDGIMGKSWNIAGLGAISRVPATTYYDGMIDGVDFDADDRFALNGQRLIWYSGNPYGQSGSEYRLEQDQSVKITYNSGYFLVKTADGTTCEYGNTIDSKVAGDCANTLSWHLNKMTNNYGQVINISYAKSEGWAFPALIRYGVSTIEFYYKYRDLPQISYLNGNTYNQPYILDNIQVWNNSTTLRKYSFTYFKITGTESPLLSEVVYYGISNEQLNSTLFKYNLNVYGSPPQLLYNSTNSSITYKSRIVNGDFNGDGKADLLCIPNPNKEANWSAWRVLTSNGDDSFTYQFERDPGVSYSDLKDVFIIDLNEDGKDDVVYEKLDIGILNVKTYFYYMINNGSGFSAPVSFFNSDQSSFSVLFNKLFRGEDFAYERLFDTSDFNGDGRNDIFICNNQGTWRIFSMSGTSTMTQIATGTFATASNIITAGDFNGDGKTDIWEFDSSGPKIFTLNGNSLSLLYSSVGPNNTSLFIPGDFNCDGKMDLFLYGYIEGGYKVDINSRITYMSTGTGFIIYYNTLPISGMASGKLGVGDFNGDGCSDLMFTQANAIGSFYFLSKNNGTAFSSVNLTTPEAGTCLNVADFDGDGLTDVLWTDKESSWWNGYKILRSPGNNQNLLTEVSNGLDHYTKITYVPLSKNSTPTVYTKGAASTYPLYTFQGPLNVVSKLEADNGIGGTLTMSYTYEGAKIHRLGKGFMGFSKVTATNGATGIINENSYEINTTYYYPKLMSSIVKYGTSGNISTVSNIWAEKTFSGSKRFIPYVSSSTSTDNLKNFSATTTTTLDDYGNVIWKVTANSNGPTNFQSIDYNNDATNWLVARPCSLTTTMALTIDDNIVQLVTTTYDAGKVKPDVIKYFDGATQKKQLNNDYNSNGTLSAFHELSTGLTEKHSYFSYDANYINLTNKTSPDGSTTAYSYYAPSGLVNTVTDYWGNTTTYSYDNLGNISSVSKPGGIGITSNTLAFVSSPTYARYSATQTGTDGSQSVAYYDLLGREIRKGAKLFDGTISCTQTDYNAKGQAYRVSEPFLSTASPSLWNTTTFDNYGRVLTFTPSVGAQSTYDYPVAYPGRTNRTSNSRTYTTNETNMLGWVSSRVDPGGTLSYLYKPDGNVKQITAPGSVVTTMTYDAFGNQLTLNDPSAGNTTYTYYGGGEFKTQVTPLGTTTNYYQADGKIDYYTNPAGTYDYSYGTNKQVSSITSPGSVSRSYTYLTNGKVDVISETIETGQTNKVKFVYDSYGRVSSKTYTNSNNVTQTEGYIYNNGYLDQITFNGTVVYDVSTMNVRGQILTASIGGNAVTWGYDSYGNITSSAATGIQGYTYTPNTTTGNLTSRSNSLRSLTESFGYDTSDRLTSVTGTNALTLTYDTGGKGNIATKSDAGTLVYDLSGKPYAVGHVTPYTANFPATAQAITYTSFGKVNTIAEGTNTATFKYNADNERVKMVTLLNGAVTKTKYYFGSSYEKVIEGGVTTEYIWIGGSPYTAVAVAKIVNGAAPVVWSIFRDHLGTITHIKNGTNPADEYSFDAYGRRRDKDDWSYTLSGEPVLFADRGFTGHEHLDLFGLINMNGRLYDPVVGRFLSPDNYVQAPGSTQGLNRYSYCLNNPLRYNDPSGDEFTFWHFAAGCVFGMPSWSGILNHASGQYTIGQAIGSYLVNSAAILVGAGVGSAVSSALGVSSTLGGAILNGSISGASSGFVGGFIGGAGNSWINGNNFGTGISNGLTAGGYGALGGAFIGGITGGIQYQRSNLLFQNGCDELGVKGADPVPSNDLFLSDAQKAWYKDAPMDKVGIFTVEKVPSSVQNVMDANKAAGATRALHGATSGKLTGISNVYFNKNLAFSSAKQLYFTMGHEFVHVSQYAALAGQPHSILTEDFSRMLDFHAYNYQASLGGARLSSYTANDIVNWTNSYSQFSSMAYINFPWTFNSSFIYPF